MWDKYAPVAHLEQLEFASEAKDAPVVLQTPFRSELAHSRVICTPQFHLPAAFRSAALKHCSRSPHNSIVLSCIGHPADFRARCNATLEAATQELVGAGFSWSDVSGVIVQLADISNFASFNQCYAGCVPRSAPPTRFSVCVSFEEPILFVISIQFSRNRSKHMHVESVSFWAPANIGPYSQSQLYAGDGQQSALLLVSGQIALVPERMVLAVAEGGQHQQLEAECAQVSRNLAAVVAANGVTECALPPSHWCLSRDFVCAQVLVVCSCCFRICPW